MEGKFYSCKARFLCILIACITALSVVGIAACNYVPHDKTFYETELPIIYVNTVDKNAQITSKENYVDCIVSIDNVEEDYLITEAEAGIRLRGNSTKDLAKKPYRIKFSSKQSFMGLKKNKSWVLLAMYLDISNIKDYAAFSFAKAIGSKAFVPNATHVEVYLNGEYQGLYLLCEQVDEKSGRTNVEDEDYFAAAESKVEDVPFLVEWDANAPEDEGKENEDKIWFKIKNPDLQGGLFSDDNDYFNVKYPEFDDGYDYTQEHFDYIKSYIEEVNGICRNPDITQAEFEKKIDLGSFIDYYLIQEFMGQTEINKKSIYMSRKTGKKLVMGPIWDFDWTAGGPIGTWHGKSYDGKDMESDNWFSSTNWFAHMLKVSWFKEAVAARWEEIKPLLLEQVEVLEAYKAWIATPATRNTNLWRLTHNGKYDDFNTYYDWVMEYFKRRTTKISALLAD